MKTAFIFLAIGIFILFLLWLSVDVYLGKSTIDIHLHDTYYVIADLHFFLLIFLFLGSFFFVGGSIGSKFHNKVFLILLLIFLAADAYIVWKIYSAFNH